MSAGRKWLLAGRGIQWPTPGAVFLVAGVMFAALGPMPFESYNTINQRAFLDLFLTGNPFTQAGGELLNYYGRTWPLDWPYPPLTIVLLLPAWTAFHITGSEFVYQAMFKLPLFASAVATQVLINRTVAEQGTSGHRTWLERMYVLSPVVVLLTTVLGGFDVIAAWLIVLALRYHARARPIAGALALGLAGALRLYPLVLVPLLLLQRGGTGAGRRRELASCVLVSVAPLLFSCLPFVLLDSSGFFTTLGGQALFGPLATLNAATPVIRSLLRPLGFLPDFQTLGYFFVGLLAPALISVYVWAVRRQPPLLVSSLLALLVFFLVYPKVHGLYTVSLLPLALLQSVSLARWTWVPGVLWMILVNGTFGGTGVFYWLGPLTGTWMRALPEGTDPVATMALASLQAALIVGAILEIALERVRRRSAPFPKCASVSIGQERT